MKNIVLEEQMELTLGNANNKPAPRRKSGSRRAGWWFGQMRNVVDKAIDWKPRPAPSAQVYLTLEQRPQNW